MKTKQRGVCPRFLFGFGLLIVLFNIFMALFLHERSWDMHTGILMTPHAVKSTSSIKSHVVYWVQEPGIIVTGFPSPSTSPRSYWLPAGSLAVAETGDSDSTLRQLVFPVVGSVPASLLTEVAPTRTVSASCAPSSFRTHVAFVDSKSAATATATTTTAVDCCSACVQQKGCNSWSFVGASDCRLMHFSEIPSQQPLTKTSRGTTSGSLQDWFIVVSPPGAALDPFLLRLREPSDTWTGQWPIGSGSMGALVGGSSTSEVIPLSISGLYVTEKNALGAKAPVDATVKIAPRSKLDAFKSAREALKRGTVTGALHDLAQLEDSGLGMFEYAGDLVLRFSDVPLRPVDQQNSQHNARAQQRPKRKGLGPLFQKQPQPAERAPGFMPSSSRRGVITRLEELFEPAPLKRSAEAYESRLDTRLGVATSVFIGLASGNQPVRGHTREWFASSVDQVLAGDARCSSFPPEGLATGPCLNVALLLARQSSAAGTDTHAPTQRFDIERYDLRPAALPVGEQTPTRTLAYSIDLAIQESTTQLLPSVHVCAVVICSSSNSEQFSFSRLERTPDVLVCNGADRIQTVLSMSLDQKHTSESNRSTLELQLVAASIRTACRARVAAAVALGWQELRDRHETDFSAAMDATTLVLSPGAWPRSGPRSIPQMFQHARYLHLSSSRLSVGNLVGLWADGPVSAWNGSLQSYLRICWMIDCS